jgi:transitional endoplasmic reticulum ATPase
MTAITRTKGRELEAQVADIGISGRDDLEGCQMCLVSSGLARDLGLVGVDGLVEVRGSRGRTLLRPFVKDTGGTLLGLDGWGRENTGCEVGDLATVLGVRPDSVKEAKGADLIVTEVTDGAGELIENLIEFIREAEKVIGDRIADLTFCSGNSFATEIGEHTVRFIVRGPSVPFIVGSDTRLTLRPARKDIELVTWDDIGGLDEEIDRVREAVELPIRYPQLFERMRLDPPKGILLTGPPGTGKTLIGKALSSILDFEFIFVDGGGIMSRFYGESEKILKGYFDEARKRAPCVLFVDEIDALAPKRGDGTSNVEGRVVSTLLTEMDGMKKSEKVIVIGATNRVDALDPALRRPGRFEREIGIGVPNEESRREIFEIHLRGTPFEGDLDEAVRLLAGLTHGFVGADIAGAVRAAKFAAIREKVPSIDDPIEVTEDELNSLTLKEGHLRDAMQRVTPSALRQFILEIPDVRWSQIGGLGEEVTAIQESVVLPLKKPEKFKEIGAKAPSGLLLYGPPGCGKTLIAKAVATESEANFISIKGPELLSKWVGESEKAVRQLFDKARQVSPCVVFIDEADTVGRSRGLYSNDRGVGESMLSQLLTELDGVESRDGIVVIMATNRPDIMDPALLRPGRVDKFIYVSPPDEGARLDIFRIHGGSMKVEPGIDFESLAKLSEGYTGADIESVCNEAGMTAIRLDAEEVKMSHFRRALDATGPSLTDDMLKYYEKTKRTIRARGPSTRDYEKNYI